MASDHRSNENSGDQTVHSNTDQPARLLVADKSATIRSALVRAMPKHAQVYEAEDGEQAWKLLKENNQIELVIAELDMPRLNGYDLLQRIRSSEISRIASIPVIVVTGAEDTKAKLRAFELGANDFISKNADVIEIRARVRAHHKLALLIHELEASRKILYVQANTDALTKLTNRHSFFPRAVEALKLMQHLQQPFSVLMLDIDHFKVVNDSHGHLGGDHVLIQVAEMLGNNIRKNDILVRYGGEEFAIAAPNSTRLTALKLAEQLRKAVENAVIRFKDVQIPVTISIGVAAQDKNYPVTFEELLEQADTQLYNAKQNGRNRLCATDGGEEFKEFYFEIDKPNLNVD